MKSINERLDRLEAKFRPLDSRSVEFMSEPFDFQSFLEDLHAEKTRFTALSTVEKVQHLRAEIARRKKEAQQPAPPDRPGSVPGLSAAIWACRLQDVKNGFHSEYYEIRRYEIELLRERGYDVKQLQARHSSWKNMPWQWSPENEVLPADAQHLIDSILSA